MSIQFNNGKALVPVTFGTPGTESLTLTDTTTPLVGTASTDVGTPPSPTPITPIAATQFAILLPSNVPAGLPVQVQVLAEGADGQPALGYSGTPTLSVAPGTANLVGPPGTTVPTPSVPTTPLPTTITVTDGRAQIWLTFPATDVGAQQTLTLTDDTNATNPITGTATVNVLPSPTPTPIVATQFKILAPATVISGLPVMVQAVAEDASGQPVPSYAGTATLASTNCPATLEGVALPTTVTFDHGQAVFSVVFTDPSATSVTTTLTLNDSSSTPPVSGTSSKITVRRPRPRSAPTGFAILLPPVVPSGVPVTVHAQAVAGKQPTSDYSGSPTLSISGGCSATLTLNGTTVSLPTQVTFTDGQAEFPLVFTITDPSTTGSTAVPTPVATTLTLTDTTANLNGTATFGVFALPSPIPQPPPTPLRRRNWRWHCRPFRPAGRSLPECR